MLYVEDNPVNRLLVEKIIKQVTDFVLISANDAETGLLYAASQRPDLIILDITLPGMNGFEMLDHLRREPETAGIPVMALSANAMAGDVDRGHQAGFDFYLTKPLDVSEFLSALHSVLNKRSS